MQSIPDGFCQCGCGGVVVGSHHGVKRRYLPLHRQRMTKWPKPIEPPNPSGLCLCGCGQVTPIASGTKTRLGWLAGEHIRYVRGHNAGAIPRDRFDGYEEQDCGFGSQCWIWQGRLNEYGYGIITTDDGQRGAHRVYYERAYGPVPNALPLDHLCRVRSCVNPGHLEVVTPAENVQRGSLAKLTPEEVTKIRSSPLSSRAAASVYGVSPSQIKRIRRYSSWRNRQDVK